MQATEHHSSAYVHQLTWFFPFTNESKFVHILSFDPETRWTFYQVRLNFFHLFYLYCEHAEGAEAEPGVDAVEVRHWAGLAAGVRPQRFVVPDRHEGEHQARHRHQLQQRVRQAGKYNT